MSAVRDISQTGTQIPPEPETLDRVAILRDAPAARKLRLCPSERRDRVLEHTAWTPYKALRPALPARKNRGRNPRERKGFRAETNLVRIFRVGQMLATFDADQRRHPGPFRPRNSPVLSVRAAEPESAFRAGRPVATR